MRNSDGMVRKRSWLNRHAPWGAVLLTACTVAAPLSQSAPSPPSRPACQEADPAAHNRDDTALAELRQGVEQGPLFTVPAAAYGVASCRIRRDASSVFLEYRFQVEGGLIVQRDATIELTDIQASYRLPASREPTALLRDAEHAAFGPDGCGMDWKRPETPAGDPAGVSETIFHGDVCNCQARIRRDRDGQVIGLMLRSAC